MGDDESQGFLGWWSWRRILELGRGPPIFTILEVNDDATGSSEADAPDE